MVKEMLPLAASDGLLHKMSSESISFDKLVSIVVDLIMAAADTVSRFYSSFDSKRFVLFGNIFNLVSVSIDEMCISLQINQKETF